MTEAQFHCALEQAEAIYTNIFESKAMDPLTALINNLSWPEREPLFEPDEDDEDDED
jgi:hypothetical protein